MTLADAAHAKDVSLARVLAYVSVGVLIVQSAHQIRKRALLF